jgi:iron complex outermembrane recepter protein
MIPRPALIVRGMLSMRIQSCVSALLCVLAAGPVSGQAQPQPADALLDEVVVTAQRRAQSIQQVPISITAFAGDYLQQRGADTVADVARMTPGFTVSHGSQQTNNIIAIRGIGSVGNSAIESSVGVFIDGVYYPRAGSLIGLLPDIETFEVLRGPQGTLFGRNALIGALNITTRKPVAEPAGSIEAGYGDHDQVTLGGVVNGPLAANLAGRLAVRRVARDGYGFNSFDNRRYGARDDVVARGKLRFDPAADLSLLLTLDYARIDAEGGAIEVLNTTATPAFDARLGSLYGATATTADSYDWRINQDHRDDLRDEQGGLALDVHYNLAAGLQLRSISAWRQWRANVLESAIRIPADLLPRFTVFDTHTLSQELQLLSPAGGRFDWVAGLFLYREDYDIDQGFDAGGDFCVPTIQQLQGPMQAQQCQAAPQYRVIDGDFAQDLDSFALFGQGTWHVHERLATTLGLRRTSDRKRADFMLALRNPFAALVRLPETTTDMHRNDSRTTWFANLSWFPRNGTMLFATASTGYKSGGFNPEGSREVLGAGRRTFGPEHASNLELGVKSTLPGGRATANLTAYRTDVKDFQDRAFDGISFNVLNVGKVRQQGVEADLRWKPVDALRLVAGIGYLDSRYLRYPAAPPLPGDSAPQDLSGERKTLSPRWQFALDADGTVALGARWALFAGAGWQYLARQNIGLISNNNPQSMQPGYALLNARAGVRSASGRWELALLGNNLTDKGYCLTLADQPLGTTLGAQDAQNRSMVQRCVVGAPRTWGMRLRWQY